MRGRRLRGVLLALLPAVLGCMAHAQVDAPSRALSRAPAPIEGSLMFAGRGELPRCALDCFVALSGAGLADIVLISSRPAPRGLPRWRKQSGARSVRALGTGGFTGDDLTLAMLTATGVWLEDAAEPAFASPVFQALLASVLARGGAVGGQGEGAIALQSLLPRATFVLPKKSRRTGGDRARTKVLLGGDGQVGWQIPARSALVISRGRRVGAYGASPVVVSVAAANGWPERRHVIQPLDAFDFGDVPPYELDLLVWQRLAQERTGPLFPTDNPPKPDVGSKGTLVLSGGGGVQSPTWRRFIKAAGGKDKRIVCIPSATTSLRPGAEPNSYSARGLREAGCDNVVVLHTEDPRQADEDESFLAQLRAADGIWIDGGRTFKFMDAFQGTRSHDAIRAVLARGGVVGGSSAGCQVAGDFLVRGDPRTNQSLIQEGYTRGLGLLEGVILDAHFRQREREGDMAQWMADYPQMLGIGVDADTALVIQGSKAEVVGNEAVSFYDARDGDLEPVILRQGAVYDLVARRTVR